MQLVLILIALVCVPWMWFAKPYYLKLQHEKHKYGAIALPEDESVPTAAVAATEASTRAAVASESTPATEVVHDDDEEDKEEVS